MTLPLETRRLTIREFTSADAPGLARAFADPGVLWWDDEPFTLAAARAWIRRALDEYVRSGMGLYAVVRRSDERLIGDCGLVPFEIEGVRRVEIGWHLERNEWGKGYATEAAHAVVTHAQGLGLTALCSLILPENLRSRRVAEKLGMTIERGVVWRGLAHDLWAVRLNESLES